MKNEMTALDIKFLIPELKQIVGGKIRKIYQYGNKSKEFLLEILVCGKFSTYRDTKRLHHLLHALEQHLGFSFVRLTVIKHAIQDGKGDRLDTMIVEID